MTSFGTMARHARNRGLEPSRRLYALRECVMHCSPYGFRATWNYLVAFAHIPNRIEKDPDSVERAVDELEPARGVLLRYSDEYAAQRRREKAEGRRIPKTAAPWDAWGWCRIAYCPDPKRHPTDPLAEVMRRVLDARTGGLDVETRCQVCRAKRTRPGRPCRACGVAPDGPEIVRSGTWGERLWAWVWRFES